MINIGHNFIINSKKKVKQKRKIKYLQIYSLTSGSRRQRFRIRHFTNFSVGRSVLALPFKVVVL